MQGPDVVPQPRREIAERGTARCHQPLVAVRHQHVDPGHVQRQPPGGLAGIDPHWTSHQLRHALATRLHGRGGELDVTRAILGHKDVDVTRRYIDAEAIAAADRRKAMRMMAEVG